MSFIQTNSGRRIILDEFDEDDVRLSDIAKALSNICRFNGHTRSFYSVAEHSISVSRRVPVGLARAALLHDAAEAYVGDVVHPIKGHLQYKGGAFDKLETGIRYAIFRSLNVRYPELHDWEVIDEADRRMCMTEGRDLLGGVTTGWGFDKYPPYPESVIPTLLPDVAEQLFLQRFQETT